MRLPHRSVRRLEVEQLEDRLAPAIFTIANGDTAGLIAAINSANKTAEADTIVLAPGGTYAFSKASDWWYGPDALPAISSNITIEGNGATIERVGTSPFRFFYVAGGQSGLAAGNLTLDDLTLEGGLAQGGNSFRGGGGLGAGGAIFCQGTLTLDSVTLADNAAIGGSSGITGLGAGGGGIGSDAWGGNGGGFGGIPWFGGNGGAPGFVTGGGGGGFSASGQGGGGRNGGAGGGISGLGGAGGGSAAGLGGDGGGGGGVAGGWITFVGTPSHAGGGGRFGFGGAASASDGSAGGGGVGGGGGGCSDGTAADSGTAQLSSRNGGGGGFGGGGGAGGSGMDAAGSDNSGCGGSGGFGGGGGGAASSASVGMAGAGGFGGGNAVGGGGVEGNGGGGAGLGGAIFVHVGTVTLINTTLVGNSAQGGNALAGGTGGGGGSGFGGALFDLNGIVTFENCTLADNSTSAGAGDLANGQADGEAVYSIAFGNDVATPNTAVHASVTITNSILAGDIVNQVYATATAGSTATVDFAGAPSFVTGGINNQGGSVVNDGGVLSSDPGLDPRGIRDNGGPTPTIALLPSSAAIDAGSNAAAAGIPYDQRGFSRVINGTVDIGAYEYQPSPAFTATMLATSATPSTDGQTVTFTATVNAPTAGLNSLTGTVTFTIDGVTAATVTLANDTASYSTWNLSVGTHTVVATYSGCTLGDITFAGSTSAPLSQRVSPLLAAGTDAGSPGEVKVFNALTGAVQFDFFPFGGWFTGGVRVALGDVTGDGVPDIIAASGPGMVATVSVFDGRSGAQLATFEPFGSLFQGGAYVAAGNFEGGPTRQVVCGQGQNGGQVAVFDIANGTGTLINSPLAHFYPYGLAFLGGVTVAAGNFDGVGTDEVITGVAKGPALVRVFSASGNTRVLEAGFLAYGSLLDNGGVFVAAGDVNGDGKADIITGAGSGSSTVKVFSGGAAALLSSFDAYESGFTGGVRVAVLDLDGSGVDRIVTAPGAGRAPELRLFDWTGAELSAFFAYDANHRNGVFVG